jgi:hypothetical protein
MKFIKILLCIFSIFSLNHAKAQTLNCDTPTSPDFLKSIKLDSVRSIAGYATAKTVRVVFHILRNDDGSNAAATEAYLEAELVKIRNEYQPWDICFALIGFDYINNTTLNSAMNSNTSAHTEALFPNDWANALNIYCHKELRNNNGTGLIGTAYAIPSTHLSIDIPENFNGVLSHEIGHCLGLYHTFETAFGNELVNGSNCSSLGDKICDTPADPNGAFNHTTFVFTGTTSDANNQLYTPLVNNIMSYYFNCMTNFTAGQRTRIYDTIASNSTVSNMTMQTNTVSISNQSITSGNFWGTARNNLYVGNIGGTGNVVATSTANVYYTSQTISLKPGFRAAPTSGRIRVVTYGCRF